MLFATENAQKEIPMPYTTPGEHENQVLLSSDFSEQEQHFPEHCFAYGQPTQCSPRFFALYRYIAAPPRIRSITRIRIIFSVIASTVLSRKILWELTH